MAREVHQFWSRDQLTAYLIREAGRAPELAAEVADIAVRDGVVLLDNGQIFGFRAWEVTRDEDDEEGIFHVVHEFGYLAEGGEVI